jgi:ABC-type uncharacterized transport system auxiliary subunit
MKRKIIFPTLILCLGMLNACGAARPSKYYDLTVPGGGTPGPDPAPYPITLVLGRVTTSELYRDDQIVYTSDGQAMGAYKYHKWSEPPSDMIDDVLLRELQVSGRYQNVYLLRSDVRGDYLLRGHLYDLREIDGKALSVRVAFEFDLRDVKTGSTVWSRYYFHDEAVSGRDVSAVVAAMDRNVQDGLREVTGGLDQYFSAHSAVLSTASH